MAAKVDIFNAALLLIGGKTVDDPDGAAAANISAIYAVTRDATLRLHTWNFAQARAVIAEEAAGPDFGFTYQYLLPADPYCLKARTIDNDPKLLFKVEGRNLLTDESGPINLLFTARVTDTESFDPLFVEVLELRLAAKLAYSKAATRSLAADLWTMAGERLTEARSADGQEGSPDAMEPDEARGDFLMSRI